MWGPRTLKQIAPLLKPGAIVADVCSVKVYPARWMQELLPPSVEILATHPMFGPDSAAKSVAGYKIVLCPERIAPERYRKIKRWLENKGVVTIETTPAEATGYAVTEAPRGLLYHRYRIDAEGRITDAKIVPPTSQNQKSIEEDLQQMIPAYLHLPEEKLALQCEQSIRNYDPCISCATHFLKLHLEKTA